MSCSSQRRLDSHEFRPKLPKGRYLAPSSAFEGQDFHCHVNPRFLSLTQARCRHLLLHTVPGGRHVCGTLGVRGQRRGLGRGVRLYRPGPEAGPRRRCPPHWVEGMRGNSCGKRNLGRRSRRGLGQASAWVVVWSMRWRSLGGRRGHVSSFAVQVNAPDASPWSCIAAFGPVGGRRLPVVPKASRHILCGLA